MTTTPSRRDARRGRVQRRRVRRSALASGAAVLGVLLPMAGLAAAHATDPIDDIPPLLDRFIFAPNENGWHKSNPNMRLVATERGGSSVKSISYVLDGGPVQTTTAPEGVTRFEIAVDLSAHGVHELEVWTHDTAGNESIHQAGTVKVDLLAPYVSLPADATYPVDEVAFLEYDCGDQLSGIDLCTGAVGAGAQLDTTKPGVFTVPITAIDKAGNSASAVFTYTVVGPDVTGPEVSMYTDPEPSSGWYREPVWVGFTSWDLSGIVALGWNAEGPVSYTGDVYGQSYGGFTLEYDGVSEVWGWATDAAGNRSETARRVIRLDAAEPTITVNSPELPEEGDLQVEQGASVPLEFDCDDEHSGVASCHAHGELPALAASTGLDRLPTEELGPQTVTLRALDVAGNETVQEIAYTVVPAESGTDADGDADGGEADADGDADGGNADADGGDADAGGGNADGGDAGANGGNAGSEGSGGTGSSGTAGANGTGGTGSGSGGAVPKPVVKPVVKPAASGGLAVTGADSSASIAIAAVLLLSGVSVLALRASRRGVRRAIRAESGE